MDPVLLLSALLLLAFGLIGVGTAEPGLLQDHLLRVGAALLALVLGHLLPPRLLLRYALHALVGVLLLLVLVLLVGDGPGECAAGSTWAPWPSSPRSSPSWP